MSDFEKLFKKQQKRGSLITNFQTNTSKRSGYFSAQFIRQRIELLKSYWDEWHQVDLELSDPPEEFEKHDYYESDAIEIPLDYSVTKAWLQDQLLKIEGSPSTPVSPTIAPMVHNHGHFEKIKLPQFDGRQRDWDSFKDKFAALIIQDVSIPTVFKFHHLINSLTGEAANQLRGYEVVSNKFEDAWQHLCDTYDNKFLRFDAHMDAIIQLPIATKETASHLTQLITTATESICSFKALHLPVDAWDTIIIYLLRSKLAVETNKGWIKSIDTNPRKREFPRFEEFRDFIQRRIREANMTSPSLPSLSLSTAKSNGRSGSRMATTTSLNVTTSRSKANQARRCPYCNQNHSMSYCDKFLTLSVNDRRAFVRKSNLCFNCMGSSHNVANCQVRYRCLICGQQHHSRLHQEASEKTERSQSPTAKATVALTNVRPTDRRSLRQGYGIRTTALVSFENDQGQKLTARALLDTGAEESVISEHIVRFLRLPKVKESVVLTGAGGGSTAKATHRTKVLLKSPASNDFAMEIHPLVVRRMSTLTPQSELPNRDWNHLKNLQLADPLYGVPSHVDCVLSSTVVGQVILDGVKRDSANRSYPVGLNTVFGWVLMGASTKVSGLLGVDFGHYDKSDGFPRVATIQPLELTYRNDESDKPQPIILQHMDDNGDSRSSDGSVSLISETNAGKHQIIQTSPMDLERSDTDEMSRVGRSVGDDAPLDLSMDILDLSKKATAAPVAMKDARGDINSNANDLGRNHKKLSNTSNQLLLTQTLLKDGQVGAQPSSLEIFYANAQMISRNFGTVPDVRAGFLQPDFSNPHLFEQDFCTENRLQKELVRGLKTSGGTHLEPPALKRLSLPQESLHPNKVNEQVKYGNLMYSKTMNKCLPSLDKIKASSSTNSVKMVIKNRIIMPRQKQRWYRTERPFTCEHCSARFTPRSHVESYYQDRFN